MLEKDNGAQLLLDGTAEGKKKAREENTQMQTVKNSFVSLTASLKDF